MSNTPATPPTTAIETEAVVTPKPKRAQTAKPASAKDGKASKTKAKAKTEKSKAKNTKTVSTKVPVKPKAKPKAAPTDKPKAVKEASPKTPKVKKPKLVRDSFTMPKDEYAAIHTLKTRCTALAQPAKKSELLRAGIKLLAGLSDKALLTALKAVPTLKTGRPAKS